MVYLNNAASTFPKPECVRTAVLETIEQPPFSWGRGGAREGMRIDDRCRMLLAQLLNVKSPERIVLTSGATESLNLAIRGLGLSGAHIVTTAIEHNSVLRPLHYLCDFGSASLSIVPCDRLGRVAPEDVSSAIRPSTRLVAISHCSNVTGEIMDVEAIAHDAHERGALVLVDVSQSAGAVPIDVDLWKADLVAGAGHKHLFGFGGIGFLFIRPGLELEPLKTGGTGVRSELLTQPEELPLRYEAGTPNSIGMASLAAGIRFVLDTGIEAIASKRSEQFQRMVAVLGGREEIVLFGRQSTDFRSPNLNFTLRGMEPDDVAYALEYSYDIVTRCGLHCAPLIHRYIGSGPRGTVRVSPCALTTDDDIDRLVAAVLALAGKTVSSVGRP